MQYLPLGSTGLTVSKTSFGAIPIQRISRDEAKRLLLRAVDGGINFFDTARGYSDSESKIGYAFEGLDRSRLIIATKSPSKTGEGVLNDVAKSLSELRMDYVDLLQFHNPGFLPKPGGDDGVYDAALELKRQGKVRHIGITQHDALRAAEGVRTGLYETMQFPLSYLSEERDLDVVNACREHHVGFIAMKGMSGGLLTNAKAAHLFMQNLDIVVPIWGIEKMEELEEWLTYAEEGVTEDADLKTAMERDRAELGKNFCRGCGYCLPCPVDIPISIAARLSYLMKRAVTDNYLTPEWQEQMSRIENCTECGQCEARCPYHLKPYELLKEQLVLYRSHFA